MYNNDTTAEESPTIDGLNSQFGLQQTINESTHNVGDSLTFIDLIFTTQSNLVFESGVHSSLHPNCHRHLTFAKFILKILYSPPYEREV